MKYFLVFYIVFLFSMSVKTQELTPEPTIDFKILKAFKRSHIDPIVDKKLIQSQLYGLQIESEKVYRMFELPRPIHLTQGGEGSGTRGGGSGVAQISTDGSIISVDALEIYRSKNRDQYSGFFTINPNFETKPDHLTEEQRSEEIIDKVMQKLKAVLPDVSQLLQQTREDLNIFNWIDSHSRLPLIDDYIGNTMGSKQVQIAYRMYDQFVYDKFLYEMMQGLSRAAIKLHESIYAFSNTNQSLTTQRFVSLLLSTDLDRQLKALRDFKKEILTKKEINNLPILSLLIRLNLSRLSVEASLPEGLQIGEFSPNVFYSCGKIQNIEFDKTINEMKLWILNPSDKISNVILTDKKQIELFVTALGYGVSLLGRRYPEYKFPTRVTPASVVCYNKLTKRIRSIETKVYYHPQKNQEELHYAKLEVMYIKAFSRLHDLWVMYSKTQNNFIQIDDQNFMQIFNSHFDQTFFEMQTEYHKQIIVVEKLKIEILKNQRESVNTSINILKFYSELQLLDQIKIVL